MKNTLPLLAACLTVLAFSTVANADLVWCEDFSAYADGDSVDGITTGVSSLGTGTFDTNGTVAVNAFGGVTLNNDATTGRDAIQIDSDYGSSCGCFSFDVAILASPPDIIFLQTTEGGRSTTGAPIAGFNRSPDASAHGLSTDATAPSNLKLFWNTTGQDWTYTAPDGSTRTLQDNQHGYWIDNTFISNSMSTTNGTSDPGAISTMVLQSFAGQQGSSWHFDNFKMETFEDSHAVPEPNSIALFFGLSALVCIRRRK